MRNFLIILTLFLLLAATILVIVMARGYQFDFKKIALSPTGILVTTSDPDGAAVLINGKLTTATNNTINLAPGKYSVKITKDGFNPWEKPVSIKAEEVFKTSALLFPNTPQLTPLTLTGAKSLGLSPDGTKIAYTIASASAEKNGLWVLEMNRNPFPGAIFGGAESRLISKTPFTSLYWSPDSKQILASVSAVILDTDRLNTNPESVVSVKILTDWQEQINLRYQSQTAKLPPKLLAVLASSSGKLQFSPDENKIFYQATVSAFLPLILSTYLPGTNPTPETRAIKPGNYYVYDTKEDKNYEINNCPNCTWFPSSRHLLSNSDKEISIMEYDGTNKAVIYTGPFAKGVVFPWPDSRKIVILTSLNSPPGLGENLYAINLR